MQKRIGYLFWILLLAFGLMLLITAAQLLAKENIGGLKKGNTEAVITFTINNRLQDLINLSFELESKISNPAKPVNYRQSLLDSLAVLGYNTSVLKGMDLSKEAISRFDQLSQYINRQVALGTKALQFIRAHDPAGGKKIIDSIRTMRLADSVYAIALTIEKYLEKDLQATLNNNTKVSSRLSAYNKILAIIAITAVLILGTIIINRHVKQMQLIRDLEKAKTEAQRLAGVKEQFLANMSHEIRTPLNAIKGFTKILSESALDKEQKRYTSIISDASDKLVYIVNDILDIAKIEAGKLRIEEKEFNILRVLDTVEYMFQNTALEKQLEYLQQVDEQVPLSLKGDPDRLLQIIVNLVSNAIKFTRTGFVSTVVSKINEDGEKVWIMFSVEDSGPGIPADKQETIFQRFEQLGMGNDNVTKGTGLGLSIVKSLTELMHGSITLHSEPGQGSRFSVLLPFYKVVQPMNKETADRKINEQAGQPRFNASVLVVEDNKVNQLLLKHTLERSGITVSIAGNGSEALDLLSCNPYDLVLLDIQMPVMDGYETIYQLRHFQKLTVPVVAMTAYAMPGEKDKCIRAGMNDYLPKPVDFNELNKLLERYLDACHENDILYLPDTKKEEGFLLQLSEGDTVMTRKILVEIKSEIPRVLEKIEAMGNRYDTSVLGELLHHMISTFALLGTDNPVMRKIEEMREEQEFKIIGDITPLVAELKEELRLQTRKLETRILTLEQTNII